MSDETPPKQYLLMVSEVQMLLLARIVPGITFLEVQGMDIQGSDTMKLLATPVPKAEEIKADE